MRKSSKKGFTIVELVIVIAVIAILAAVLVPTFSGVIDKANESAALQRATNAYKEAMAEELLDGVVGSSATSDGFTFTWTEGSTDAATVTVPSGFKYTVTVSDGKVTVALQNSSN